MLIAAVQSRTKVKTSISNKTQPNTIKTPNGKIKRKFQELWLRYQMILQVNKREKFSRNYFQLPKEGWQEPVDRQNRQTNTGKQN